MRAGTQGPLNTTATDSLVADEVAHVSSAVVFPTALIRAVATKVSGEIVVNIEARLRVALADLLDMDVQQISPTMSFDDLGLDSLLGLRFARQVGEVVGAEIDLEWIFDYPTVRELSGFLEARAAGLAA